MDSKILAIAIPTYNRKKELQRLVASLSKLNFDNFNLYIFDNCSNYDVNSALSNLIDKDKYVYHQRAVNIGFIGNILRILEEVEEEWLMIIGDDDEVNEDITNVLEIIGGFNSSVIACKFSSDLYKTSTFDVHSIEQFVDLNSNPQAFGSSIFLSTWLFNTTKLKKYLHYAYLYGGTQIPHVIPVLMALDSGNNILRYHSLSPVKFNMPELKDRWNIGLIYTSMAFNLILCSFIKTPKDFTSLFKAALGGSYKSTVGFFFRVEGAYGSEKSKLIFKFLANDRFLYLSYMAFKFIRMFRFIPIINKYLESKMQIKIYDRI
jgi:glycosyltransferase involved in cell wall biosynthesis